MNRVRFASAIVAMSALPALSASAQPALTPLGRWESDEVSQGGLGQTLEFGRDELIVTAGVVIDGTYELDSIELTRHVSINRTALTVRYLVRGDTLFQWKAEGGDTARLARTGASASRDGLVGQWTYRHSSGAAAFESYTSAGTWHLRIPFRADTAAFAVGADTLIVRGGSLAGSYRMEITGDRLVLTPLENGARQVAFVRARAPAS